VFAFCWLRVWIVSQVDTSRFKAILDLLPGDWQRFTPVDFDWLITYQGRISLAYDELIVVMGVSIWAIARGSDCVSGEIGRGTMEMLLAQPVSRMRWLWTHAAVTLVGVAVIALAAWSGNWIGIQVTSVEEPVVPTWQLPFPLPLVGSEVASPFGSSETRSVAMAEKVDSTLLIPASVNLFALGVMLSGFTTAMSAWDRYRWRTIGIVSTLYVIQVAVKLAGLASSDWNGLLYLTVFTAYEPEFMARVADTQPEFVWAFFLPGEGQSPAAFGPLAYHALLVAVAAVCYAAASVIFWRRDIPAPL
jgi:ABC-2 type transport system permease protein